MAVRGGGGRLSGFSVPMDNGSAGFYIGGEGSTGSYSCVCNLGYVTQSLSVLTFLTAQCNHPFSAQHPRPLGCCVWFWSCRQVFQTRQPAPPPSTMAPLISPLFTNIPSSRGDAEAVTIIPCINTTFASFMPTGDQPLNFSRIDLMFAPDGYGSPESDCNPRVIGGEVGDATR